MKVTIVGTGYVGLVTGACLAEVGNHVMCVDKDAGKIDHLRAGGIPIYEPGLETMVQENVEAGRLDFSTSIAEGVRHGQVVFIAVGTPPNEDGSADLQHILDVAQAIGEHIEEFRVVVTKSTVPVATADKVRAAIEAALTGRGAAVEFSVASNPEFLKEGAAVEDFMKPDRIVVGAEDERTVAVLRQLYAPFNRSHDRMLVMDIRSAELTKYAANAMLATKISFMNEIANLAERVGADVELVRQGIGSDPRIGYHFIYPGCGYGGSCFPKDVRALHRTARQQDFDARILEAVEAVNDRQKHVLGEKIVQHFGGSLDGRRFALWGLSFKPDTDDMREAPSRVVMEDLWAKGAHVAAYDPVAMDEAKRIYGERDELSFGDDPYAVLDGADALVVVTEWRVFRSPSLDEMAGRMKGQVVFDGRNIFDPQSLRKAGFKYFGIWR